MLHINNCIFNCVFKSGFLVIYCSLEFGLGVIVSMLELFFKVFDGIGDIFTEIVNITEEFSNSFLDSFKSVYVSFSQSIIQFFDEFSKHGPSLCELCLKSLSESRSDVRSEFLKFDTSAMKSLNK